MIVANMNVIAGTVIFSALVIFVYLLKSIDSGRASGPKIISEAEKKERIQSSIRSMLCSPDLGDIGHAQMLLEGMCHDNPAWLLDVLGDFRTATPKWMRQAPHRQRILLWARSKLIA